MPRPATRRGFLQSLAAGAAASATTRVAAQTADPLGVRADFPVAATRLYLNAAYIAPTPRVVADAGAAFAVAKAEAPPSLGEMQRVADDVRARYAALINASPDEIAFLYSTSEGENIVARGLDLKPGDNVVVDELHYNTTFVLYRELERTHGITLRIVPAEDGAAGAEAFARHMDARTRMLSVAWVSHQNGYRHDMAPLAALAKRHGAWFYSDGVQAVGMFPNDVKAAGVDVMTSGTYKWLLGSYGVAPCYIRRELVPRIPLDRFGALHVEKELGDHRYQIFSSAKRFDYATPAFGPIYQLGAALTYLQKVGVGKIETHTVGLADRLNRGLRAQGRMVLTPLGNASSIVSFRTDPAADPGGFYTKAGVDVSVREGGRMVRVSPALYNTADDIDRFLAITKGLARG